MTTFSDFNLAGPVLKALDKEGYSTPTPIQEQAIPLVMEGGDLLGIAQTGTGKTAAFALPLLHHLCKFPNMPEAGAVRCLILAPTRELARQIADSFSKYGQCLALRILTVYGGVPIRKQMRDLQRGCDVLVATPGRLIDLMEQNAVDLSYVEKLVLDEADQMLDLGFIHPLRQIAAAVPSDRQTLFFSATMPANVSGLAGKFLTNPKKVSVDPESTTAERVEQSMTHVNGAQKTSLLLVHLQDPAIDRALVFMRTKHGADKVVAKLLAAGIHCGAIHGNKSQGQRERALHAFRSGQTRVLVATDIAARGIDVPGVSHVFNYEIPNVPEQYVHRIGRTARAGREGKAISFVARDEKNYLQDIQRQIRMKIPIVDLPDGFVEQADSILANATPIQEERPRGRDGGRDGGRGGRDGGRGSRDGGGRGRSEGGYQGNREGGRSERPNRDDRMARVEARADAPVENNFEVRAERTERPNRDERFAPRERTEGGRSEGGYRGNREGGRSEGRSGYQGRSENGRSSGGRSEGGYQGNRDGGRSTGGGYQGRPENARSSGGRSEGGYQGNRDGGRSEGGGYQGRPENARPSGGRSEGGYQVNRDGGRSSGGGYQGRPENARSSGGRSEGGYQGNRDGGRSEGRSGYQGRSESGRSFGGRSEGGYQGNRDGGRSEGRGFQGNSENREPPNREARMRGERPPSRGYEGSNPRPRTEYDKARAADGRSWGNDRKEGGDSAGGRGGDRTWTKRPEGGSGGPRQEGRREDGRPARARTDGPTFPGSRGGNSGGNSGGGNRFEKRAPRSESGSGEKGGFSSPRKPDGGKRRPGPMPGPKSKGPFSGRKPSFAR